MNFPLAYSKAYVKIGQKACSGRIMFALAYLSEYLG